MTKTNIVVGQVKFFKETPQGGFWFVWSDEGRFQIFPGQFKSQPTPEQIVSFLPDPQSKGNLRKVKTVVFEPQCESVQ